MNLLRETRLLFVSLLLAGCSGPTLYQPADPDYGYKEQQLEGNRFRVTFAGNSLTEREAVENYLLYRAAEITLERGYDYFVVADQNLEAKTRYAYSFSAFPGYGYYRLYGYQGTFVSVPLGHQTWPRTRYEAVANIVLFHGEPPVGDVKAFNAREVRQFLDLNVQRPENNVAAVIDA